MLTENVFLAPPTGTLPWFEATEASDLSPSRFEVTSLPFSVGRSKTTDMMLSSRQVSRVQARIVRVGDELRIRDNGSRNGTFVNGARVSEAELSDGDLVAFADAVFRFHFPSNAEFTDEPAFIVDRPSADEVQCVEDVIGRVRQMHEIIIHRAFCNKFVPVARLEDRVVVGMEYLGIHDNLMGANTDDFRMVLNINSPLTHRLHQVLRLAATEDFSEESRKGFLFLEVQPVELSSTDLLWEFCKLVNVTEKPELLVVGLPFAQLLQVSNGVEILNCIRSLGLRSALTDFDGTADDLAKATDMRTDFLKLTTTYTHGVEHSSARQEEVREIVKKAAESNTIVMASGIVTEAECDTCRTLGCYLGEGPLFVTPQNASA